jgi:acetyltransferase-like isoleucine patch superfamily enzyme
MGVAAVECPNIGLAENDPFDRISGLRSKLKSAWMQRAYPFAGFGKRVHIHHSCEISRSISPFVQLGDGVYLGPGVWLDVASDARTDSREAIPRIVIGSGCEIGRRSTISARNRVVLEADVLLAPEVMISDQGGHTQDGGSVFIGRNCWLGIGAVIGCDSGEINIGRNSVVAANAVVTQSFPSFSLIAGNPAKLIKTYDQLSRKWVRVK